MQSYPAAWQTGQSLPINDDCAKCCVRWMVSKISCLNYPSALLFKRCEAYITQMKTSWRKISDIGLSLHSFWCAWITDHPNPNSATIATPASYAIIAATLWTNIYICCAILSNGCERLFVRWTRSLIAHSALNRQVQGLGSTFDAGTFFQCRITMRHLFECDW